MRRGCGVIAGGLLIAATSGCNSREEAMRREIELATEQTEKAEAPELAPSHPLRDELAPVLRLLYVNESLPRVIEADIDMPASTHYQVEPGVAAVVRFEQGLSRAEAVKAIVTGVAEADAWAFRPDARRTYADLIHRVQRGFGDEAKQGVLESYAQLKLLDVFNGTEVQAAIAQLPENLRGPVEQMRSHYVSNRDDIWAGWMNVKMLARRVVAQDEPFLGMLRNIQRKLGHEEPEPVTWKTAFDAPLRAWAQQVRADEELFVRLSNLKEMRDREAYFEDTHARWVMQGSPMTPKGATNVAIDRSLGFGVHAEDLGAGVKDLTFVFPRGASGTALKAAFLRSIIYAHLLRDFALLATAGSDFATRNADNQVDMKTAIVPDAYDSLYARCGAAPALDTLVAGYGREHALLSGLKGNRNTDASLKKAHRCVLEGAKGDIYVPERGDKTAVEGPAPASRLALYQMLSRFERIDVDIARMQSKNTEEDLEIKAIEAELKALKASKGG